MLINEPPSLNAYKKCIIKESEHPVIITRLSTKKLLYIKETDLCRI